MGSNEGALFLFDDAALVLEEIEPEDKSRNEVLGSRVNLYMAAAKSLTHFQLRPIISRLKLPFRSSIMFSVPQIRLPSGVRQSSRLRKPSCVTTPLRNLASSRTNCVKIAAGACKTPQTLA